MKRGLNAIALLIAFSLAACGGGGGSGSDGGSTPPPVVPPPTTYTATSGVAQKGPLSQGSTVTVQELDSGLSPTGKQYSYQITSNLGTFAPTSTFGSQYIGANASGFYFDEVANAVSAGPVTLTGYSNLATESVLNVNLLTTLAYQRIQNLVANSKLTFIAARTQAEREVLSALNIPPANYGSFSTLDMGGGSDGDHILVAMSSIFVYGNSAGPLSQLIANFQSDIGTNGVITNAAIKSTLLNASRSVNPAAVAANLTQAYSSVGVSFAATDIANWIDQDGDGVVGKFQFRVPDATQSSVFTFPSFVVSQVAGTSVSTAAGQLSVNGTPATGAVAVKLGDVLTLSPGIDEFINGVATVYLLSDSNKVARVSFVRGLLSIEVTPLGPSIAKGLTQQFRATGTFSDASTADLTSSANWTSGTPVVATIDATSGLATSIAVGSTVVTATSGSVSGSTTLTVTPAILESIVISPSPAYSGVGLERQLIATGTYSDATTANVTNRATWVTTVESVATVGPTTGLTTGVSLGTTTISATIGSVNATTSLSIVANTWSPTGSLATARETHTATLLPSGKVLVVGGQNSGGAIATAELYDPVTGTWSPAASLATARSGHTATLLPSGKVLVAGGMTSGFPGPETASAELYEPASNTWVSAGSLVTARRGHSATLLPNGKVLVVSGSSSGSRTASVELYDPIANTWAPAASLLANMAGTATLLNSGSVLYVEGSPFLVTNSELYDPAANTWSQAAGLLNSRTGFTSTLLANGKVLVAGGATQGPFVATAELYDPVANSWSAAGSLSVLRAAHAAALLRSGKVLVVGGSYGGGGTTGSAELYDPVANAWVPAGSMSTTRRGPTATVLPNGMVLVVGGSNMNGFDNLGPQASAELYW